MTERENDLTDGTIPADADFAAPDDATNTGGGESAAAASGDAETDASGDDAGVDVPELTDDERDRELRHY